MPLPPALLAKLQQRGIVRSNANEEVIAEDYESPETKEKPATVEDREFATGCPNKNNPYHVCVDFCYDHWMDGYPEERLNEDYLYRKRRMLMHYPLPEGWLEVYDAGLRRHYYWNPDTDEVSWLSPRHPHAVIGEAAPKLAREMHSQMRDTDKDFDPARDNYRARGGDADRDRYRERDRDRERDRGRDERGRDRGRDDRMDRDRDRDRDRRRRKSPGQSDSDSDEAAAKLDVTDRDRLKRANRKGIDPMDPAAYSDIKVGKWASGLTEDTKTGVDVTAGGPLFQQRPYPAPGAILRARGGRPDNEDEQ
ncbi:unnamed protein product, partial [Mesorhabditis belari]|uniref:Polyglutamine-binding protein 1 n=1 Tax=Mesorhabditis belari TaxID=2138241 RepID=A0AAF3FF53_9BILA